MDPQATLQLIFDAVKESDRDDYNEAFTNLYEWLEGGGFAPTLRNLDGGINVYSNARIASYPECKHSFAIQTVDSNNHTGQGPYEFVVYDARGARVKAFNLPMGE